MADNHSKEARSMNMSHIRSTNSKPEEIVRKYLFAEGFRYRKNVKKLPGCPDIVLPKYKTVIFVNGCFWHKQRIRSSGLEGNHCLGMRVKKESSRKPTVKVSC